MDTRASKEKRFTETIEKWIMYFMYLLFGGLFFLISIQGTWREGLILFPIALVSIPITRWGMRWQNERYVRSAQNQDDLEVVVDRLNKIEKRISITPEIAKKYISQGYKILWIGTPNGLEDKIVLEPNIIMKKINSQGIRGKTLTKKIISLISTDV